MTNWDGEFVYKGKKKLVETMLIKFNSCYKNCRGFILTYPILILRKVSKQHYWVVILVIRIFAKNVGHCFRMCNFNWFVVKVLN